MSCRIHPNEKDRQSALTVVVQQPTYSVSTGSSLTLVCTVTSTFTVNDVYWQKNVSGSTTQIRSTTNTNKYSGSTTSTPSLTILNADQSDAGVYTCFATNSVGTGQSKTTTLTVTGTLSVTAPNLLYYPAETEIVTLICIVTTGNPTQIRWYKDNQLLTLTGRFSGGSVSVPTLTVTSVVMSDAGSYICEATDGSTIARTNNIQLSPTDGSDCINPSSINLRDNQWSASTEYGSYTAQEGNRNGVGWAASSNNQFQYLKIDLEGVWQITRILFSEIEYRWVLYSENNFEWIPYNSRLSSDIFGEQFERAGSDTNITFDPPIETRYLVLNPITFQGRPSLKVELYGCRLKDQTKSVTQISKDVEVLYIYLIMERFGNVLILLYGLASKNRVQPK
ncbi:Hypothetical predicted protein [Mytilus galloprovincialis]|uniref:Uncharacterized protein n=1 Tax=Mytilus galloprovincialis TaxID=29158 RepID=A0A8B6F8M7_MYTGA|nr:Hypothetical predicted protein [Mytilus galloprovincialis]